MANRDKILDGLAWAGISEQARVSKISALLVRKSGKATKTAIKEAVRDTSPPYGRGKIITTKVEAEYDRQLEIFNRRQKAQTYFQVLKETLALMSVRVNRAYAYAFARPSYVAYGSRYPDDYWDWDHEKQSAYDEDEENRDKGDSCTAITHWGGHAVALLDTQNGTHNHHIATARNRIGIVRTYLRHSTDDLVQAAISLGGPKVKAAFAQGIRVTTDWVGRKTTVHYTKQREVELPWRAVRYEEQLNQWGVQQVSINVLINGNTMIDDEDSGEDD